MWQGIKKALKILRDKMVAGKFHYMILFNLIAIAFEGMAMWVACKLFVPPEHFSLIFWSFFLPISAISLGYFGKYGIVNIPVGSVGIVLVFNQPMENPIFPSGFVWTLPPPFMDIITLDTRLRITKLGFVESADPKGWNVLCKDNEVTVHASIPWKIVKAYEVAVMTTKIIHDGIEEVVKKELREEATKWSADEFVAMKEALSDQLKIEAERISGAWGIEIEKSGVMITQMTLPADILKARRQVAIEKAEKESQTIERDHFVDGAKKIKKDLKVDGRTAANIFAAQIGKLTREEKIHTIEANITGLPPNLRDVNIGGVSAAQGQGNRQRGGGKRGAGN